jgi:plastocyanin
MPDRLCVALAVALALVATAGYSLRSGQGAAQVAAAQPEIATWNSAMVWRPSLLEAGEALTELVNQIDALCSVDVDAVVATNGSGPEGPVYAFGVTWACPAGAGQPGAATWNSAMVWRPTLLEAGEALTAMINQIEAECSVDVDPVMVTNGPGPEGPVYAFAVTWACVGAPTGTGATLSQEAVVIRDFVFAPAQLTIPLHTDVAVTVTNEGTTTHNFSVDALEISVDLTPGETTSVTLNAPAGTYEFICNVPGHRELGMVGTISAE